MSGLSVVNQFSLASQRIGAINDAGWSKLMQFRPAFDGPKWLYRLGRMGQQAANKSGSTSVPAVNAINVFGPLSRFRDFLRSIPSIVATT
jgi:hypothetical protein